MENLYLFSDEAGCMTFNRNPNVSRYFIICTVRTRSLAAGNDLADLRRRLIRDGHVLGDCFYATTDRQEVRDRVYRCLLDHDYEIQATICEKSKAQPHLTESRAKFFQLPWYFHLKHGIAKHIPEGAHLFVTAASIGAKKERATYVSALDGVVGRNMPRGSTYSVDFRPAMADCWLQIADYSAWAIQRKWERGDARSYDLISHRITYEYDIWQNSQTHFY